MAEGDLFGYPTTHNSEVSVKAKLWEPTQNTAKCDSIPTNADPLAFSGDLIYTNLGVQTVVTLN